MPAVGNRTEPAGNIDSLLRRGLSFELINSRKRHAAVNRNHRSHCGNVDDVARQQRNIIAGTTLEQQIVEIQFGNEIAISPQLDLPHRTTQGRTAGGNNALASVLNEPTV